MIISSSSHFYIFINKYNEMYNRVFHFITFILFLDLLSGFEFERMVREPDSIRISGLTFRSKAYKYVKGQIELSGYWVLYSLIFICINRVLQCLIQIP